MAEVEQTGKGHNADSQNAMKKALAGMKRITANIRRPEHVKKGYHLKIPVTINGYTVQVPTGVFCDLPEEVYLVLVRAGTCQPLRPGDEKEVPAIVTQDGPEYQLMGANVPGSMSNPIPVY